MNYAEPDPGEEAAVAALWNRVFGDDETFLADFYRLVRVL